MVHHPPFGKNPDCDARKLMWVCSLPTPLNPIGLCSRLSAIQISHQVGVVPVTGSSARWNMASMASKSDLLKFNAWTGAIP
jgi:hypothetical protein